MIAPAKPVVDRKKIAALLLLIVAAVVLFTRQSDVSGTGDGKTKGSSDQASSNRHGRQTGARGKVARSNAAEKGSENFKPSIKPWPDEVPDEKFDPALRTDLLDKLTGVRLENVGRNVFEFYAAPVAETPKPIQPVVVAPAVAAPIVQQAPPAPIPLKFYGHTLPAGGGAMKIFCVLNDQVMVASEGAVLQHRYKIQQILPTTVVVEDLEDHHKQTLPIDSQAQSRPTP
jgi:hypothetical protein